jgi:hypothetical protein
MRETLCETEKYYAYQLGETIFIIAYGKYKAAGFELRPHTSPGHVPPEYNLVHTPEKTNARFIAFTSYQTDTDLDQVVIHCLEGKRHEVDVKKTSDFSEILNRLQLPGTSTIDPD